MSFHVVVSDLLTNQFYLILHDMHNSCSEQAEIFTIDCERCQSIWICIYSWEILSCR